MQISIWNSVRINNKSCLKFSLIILLILFKFQLITISDIIIILIKYILYINYIYSSNNKNFLYKRILLYKWILCNNLFI